MGFLDALLGRTKTAKPNLDNLFGLASAQLTLDSAEGLVATGRAAVCFKPASGGSFAGAESELNDLLNLGDPVEGTAPTRATLTGDADEFGYRWVVVESADFESLVTRVHVVNSTLEEHGWGPQLLCSVFPFHQHSTVTTGSTSLAYLVYLYKRGSFYPFVPTGGERRDNEAELRLQAELSGDLVVEKDLDRWFPIWKLPV